MMRESGLGTHVAAAQVSGTEGYAKEAKLLFERYESIPAEDAHRAILHLLPPSPSHVLDIGSGTGRDAAWLADIGHRVVAVEPTDEMRIPAMMIHPSPNIEWLDDSLPNLAVVRRRDERFDLIMLIAVWMHLDAEQRRQAMPNVAALARAGATIIMKIRHGPVPAGRRMFEIPDEEIIEMAGTHDLHPVLQMTTQSTLEPNRSAGITWSNLAFVKAAT